MVSPVKALGVNAVYMSHASGQVTTRSLNQEVIMIGNEAISGDPHLVHINHFFKKLDKYGVVAFIHENRFPLRPLFITWYQASGYCIRNGLLIKPPYHITQ